MFKIYLRTEFHIPSSIVSSLGATKQKVKYTLQLQSCDLNEIWIIDEGLFSTKYKDPALSGSSCVSISEVCTTTKLVLLIKGRER
jgi:hypothetical protein